MTMVAELTIQLKDILTQIRMADPYESARLAKQAADLTMQIRREKALGISKATLKTDKSPQRTNIGIKKILEGMEKARGMVEREHTSEETEHSPS